MEQLLTRQLDLILREGGASYDWQIELPIQSRYLTAQGKGWLQECLEDLGGQGMSPVFEKVVFDFKLNRQLILWDEELAFNRYRGATFRSSLYSEYSYSFVEGHKRLCRTYEKEALKVGLTPRTWGGSPLAKRIFGEPTPPGEFYDNGATGWKLMAYNDFQIDLLARIHGYFLLRLSPYETLMTGGSLKRLDQLLVNPKEEQRAMIYGWLMRKLG